jgi:UDP-N-acetylglucosamine acyltransferase
MTEIHPTAIIDSGAQIGEGVIIGPYSIVKGGVILKDGVDIKGHVYIDGNTTVGEDTVIWPFASIGTRAQDLKYGSESTFVRIGKQCQIREYVTINSSTIENSEVTVGDQCLLMTGSHIAHNCHVGNCVIMANNATIAGHVTIGDFANLGGLVAVHQDCRIGSYAMVGGMSAIARDIPPFSLAAGNPPKIGGLNLVGLKRRGFSFETRKTLSHAYRIFYRSGLRSADALKKIKDEVELLDEVKQLIEFCNSSTRGLTSHGRNIQLNDFEKDLNEDDLL